MKGEKVQNCSSFEYIYKNGKLGQYWLIGIIEKEQ
jgi:hypothetical protein